MHTDGLLTSIGRATGWPDQSTFTRRFKACYGLSATTYRKCFTSGAARLQRPATAASSVRTHGDTKTERSRRTLALPAAAVEALRAWSGSQADEQFAAGKGWQDTGLVFTNHAGAALDAGNVRKMFKRICTEAGAGDGWTPRELRTTFVSLMSHQGVAIEEIARLAGHASTRTTEIVYRRELRPVITTGAEIMDQLFTAT
jgi:integrase